MGDPAKNPTNNPLGFQSLTQTQPKQNPLVPVTCYLSISPHAVAQLLKKIGLLSAADVQLLNREGLKPMTEKFDQEDAKNLYHIIQRRRPGWHWKGIMNSLQQAAQRGASLTQVMAAAEKTWNNQKATTPAAILWEEHWTVDKPKTAGNIMGQMLCVECTPARKHPVTEMTKHDHGWVCGEHEEGK